MEPNNNITYEPLPENPKDQFLLADELTGGRGFPDIINSRRYVRFMRVLRRHSPIAEGELAGRCSERIFMPEWQPMVEWFVKQGYATLSKGSVGRSLIVSITEKGEAFCEYKLGPKPTPVESNVSVGAPA